MKIDFRYYDYNMGSYSIVRSMKEWLEKNHKITDRNPDMVWLFNSGIRVDADEFKDLDRHGVTVVAFGHSDPNMFDSRRVVNCHVYCTNDLRLHRTLSKSYWFHAGCDLKYHRPGGEKEYDVCFVGSLVHKYIPFRREWIDKLRKDFDIRIFSRGTGTFVEGEKLIEAYQKAYLNLDIATERSSLAARLFEAAACGTVSLTRKREDAFELLCNDAFYYEDFDDLRDMMGRLLEDRDALARKGAGLHVYRYDIGERARRLMEFLHGRAAVR